MDTLTVTIEPCEDSLFDDAVYFLMTASVNGARLPDVLDIDEFFRSLTAPPPAKRRKGGRDTRRIVRRLPLFNCSCGCFGCGGFYVDVAHTPTGVVWEDVPLLADGRRLPGHRFEFAWGNLRHVAGELIAAISTAQGQHPGREVRYGATGVEVTERLPLYLERYESLPQGDSEA